MQCTQYQKSKHRKKCLQEVCKDIKKCQRDIITSAASCSLDMEVNLLAFCF